MRDFEEWQRSECAWLGITIDDHNRLLDICQGFSNMGFDGQRAYELIKSLILPTATELLEASKVLEGKTK